MSMAIDVRGGRPVCVWLVSIALLLFVTCGFPLAANCATEALDPATLGEAPVLSLPSPVGSLDYRPGRGLHIGSSGFTLGGFTNIKAEQAEESGGEFTIDRLNFFLIFDRFARFRAIGEFQIKDLFLVDEEHSGAQDFAFDVRRLFADVNFSDQIHLRTGTFLTPVGYWNLILAPPLTWTTEAPLIVEHTFFDPTTTGAMLDGYLPTSGGRLNYSFFSQFLYPIENDPDLHPADLTAGARLEYTTVPGWIIGSSYQASERHGNWSHLGGLHLFLQRQTFEVLGESLYQDSSSFTSAQWGTYLQGVLPIYRPFYLVGRYEHFDPLSPDPRLNLFTIGAVYKPLPFMALKVEYHFVDRSPEDNPAGFFSSFTTLF